MTCTTRPGDSAMFCNQCEQTARGTGCSVQGACGKTPAVAAMQDLIVYACRGLALAALEAEKQNRPLGDAGRLCVQALFSTVTNVAFDAKPLLAMLHTVVAARRRLQGAAGLSGRGAVCSFEPAADEAGLFAQARAVSSVSFAPDADCNSLAQVLLYGLKGVCAYADHAAFLGQERPELYHAIFTALAFGFDGSAPTLEAWTEAVLACGRTNLLAMELLDRGNTTAYGSPEPTKVSLTPRPGKAILVTGHDLKDLRALLEQTEGTGINVYTHGEMLPAHGYPGLKKFGHFAGHFGTAWQNQAQELPQFPGPVLFTTNCIQHPAESYRDNVFTTGLVGWPGCTHVANGEYRAVVDKALSMPGYTATDVAAMPERTVMTGFARHAVLSVAETVVSAVKSGAIRHFFLVGGCDGAKPGRNYYTEFVEKTPPDTVVLTLACGKFRFFDKDLGMIGGLPRLMDVGQCNDAFSAIHIAQALAESFGCSINELPLSLVLSWYEQKAVAILLTLLALGVRGIRLGPTLPAFITPPVLHTLATAFDLKPITTPDADLKAILG